MVKKFRFTKKATGLPRLRRLPVEKVSIFRYGILFRWKLPSADLPVSVTATKLVRLFRLTSVQATLDHISSKPNGVFVYNINPTIVSLEIQDPSAIKAGDLKPLAAIGTYSDGNTQDLSSTVSWSSLQPSIGSVSSSATVGNSLNTKGQAKDLLANSTATINASYGGITNQITVSIQRPLLLSIRVTPENPLMILLASIQFQAIGTISDGSQADITEFYISNSGASISTHWSSSNLLTSGVGNHAGTKRFVVQVIGLGQTTIAATWVFHLLEFFQKRVLGGFALVR